MIAGGALAGDSMIDPYTSTQTTFEVAKQSVTENAGENKVVVSKASPEVTFSKWDSEADFSVKYTDLQGEGSRPFFSDRIEWGSGSKEVHAYPLEASESVGEDGGFEIEVVLNEAPESNVFSFEINGAEEFDFFYQPALTEQEIIDGASRPDNVIGSYAVYHKTNKDHVTGSTNYATGKAYHIYRPKAIDANNIETWGELNIENGILTVTIPTEYLADAEYPVKVDPTFGYTTAGASHFLTGNAYSCKFTLTQNGLITGMTAYLTTNNGSGRDFKMAIYDDASNPNNKIAESNNTVSFVIPVDWHSTTFANDALNSGVYWLAVGDISGTGAINFDLYYDAGTSGQSASYSNSMSTFPASWGVPASTQSRKLSVYATYNLVRRIIIGQ